MNPDYNTETSDSLKDTGNRRAKHLGIAAITGTGSFLSGKYLLPFGINTLFSVKYDLNNARRNLNHEVENLLITKELSPSDLGSLRSSFERLESSLENVPLRGNEQSRAMDFLDHSIHEITGEKNSGQTFDETYTREVLVKIQDKLDYLTELPDINALAGAGSLVVGAALTIVLGYTALKNLVKGFFGR